MTLFSVDEDKCKRDGICVAECPARIITMRDKSSVPVPVNGAEDFCINCGHCVSVCPHGALTHKNLTAAACLPVRSEWMLNPDQAEHFLRSRRSIRSYKSDPVDRTTLQRLIEIAAHAPSGHNLQPVKWAVIYDTAELKKCNALVVEWMRFMMEAEPAMAQAMHLDRVVAAWESGIDSICRGAPHVVLAYGATSLPVSQSACTIALAYLELAVPAFDLGACWAGFFNAAATFWPPLKAALEIPEDHNAYGAMMIGQPRFRYHRMPPRNAPRITWR